MAEEGGSGDFAAAIWEHSGAGVVAVDAAGRLAFSNPAGRRILGLPAVLGPDAGFEAALSRHPRLAGLLREALAGRPPLARAEVAVSDAEGVERTLGFSVSAIPGPDGRPLGAALVFRDLTPIERHGERERMNERLAALGEMAAGLAHELRNPLASMEMSAGLLQRRLAGDPDSQELVLDLRGQLRRLADTVTASLDFLRPVALRLERVDPRELVEEALASALSRAPEPKQVERRYAPDLPTLELDRNLFGLALVNLIANACEAMATAPEAPSCLRLEVGVQNAPALEPPVRVDAALRAPRPTSGRELCIAVADTGPGVPPDRRDRIFDPFFTTKAKGSGIGLATVQKVMAGHGGCVSFESDGAGSCFRLHLPLPEPS